MHLPMQSQPVQRTIPAQPFAHRDTGGAADGERGVQPSAYGVQPSEYGIQPSGWQDWVKTIGGGILGML